MTRSTPKTRSREQGFSLVELLVAMAVLSIAAIFAMPALQNQIIKSKLESFSRTATTNLQVARQEAIKRGVSVVVEFDQTNWELFAFADVLNEGPDELVYVEATSGSVYKTEDYEVWRQPLPIKTDSAGVVNEASILFAAPDGSDGNIIVGFTDVSGVKKLVYEPDGSIRDTGAFRFGDFRSPGSFSTACGNCLQIGVSPAATAKTHLMKWDHDDDVFLTRGRLGTGTTTEGQQWVWY